MDQRLREPERRFRETVIVEDEAAWLAERTRSGELGALLADLIPWSLGRGDPVAGWIEARA